LRPAARSRRTRNVKSFVTDPSRDGNTRFKARVQPVPPFGTPNAGGGLMKDRSSRRPLRVRTLFISDVHLGYRGSQANYLLDFLQSVQADTIYLVGDIIDLWSLKRGFYWPRAHREVLRTLLERARSGTRVVYVPGNHDETFRDLCGSWFGHFEVVAEAEHVTAEGKRLLVLHGDRFDADIRLSPFTAWLGSSCYELFVSLGRRVQTWRRRFGFPYWSLADWIKHQVSRARIYIERFEEAAARDAAERGFDGVVCGHIHRAALRDIGGVLYCNDGDWVESCTALVEDRNGRLALLRWTERSEVVDHIAPSLAALDFAA
jgi:UDP-2,3-diacylglucosamine pyrophosphatase LpxH